jgi:exodeoxyribonuclease VII small subunit
MTPEPSDPLAYEQALAELERILRNLEDGTTTLEQSLAHYERGVALLKGCYQQLRQAEQRILKVTGIDGDGKPLLQPFEHAATVDDGRPGDAKRPTRSRQGTSDDGGY